MVADCSGRLVSVLAVNVNERIAYRSDDVIGDFVTLYDACGEETDDEDDAVSVVVQWRTGGFTPLCLADYETGKLH